MPNFFTRYPSPPHGGWGIPRNSLKNQELESAYRQASDEFDPDWEITVADGLA